MKANAKKTVSHMKENILKASQTSNLLVTDIRGCYSFASAVEEIMVRSILQKAVELERQLSEFNSAINNGK